MKDTDISNSNLDLDKLRQEILLITKDIIQKLHDRTLIAKKIGDLKSSLNLQVEDENTESHVKDVIFDLAKQIGFDSERAGKILNLLFLDSIHLQKTGATAAGTNTTNNNMISTHMSIFQKAKDLEKSGKEIIHLEVGEPDFSPPSIVKEELSKIYNEKHYHYTELTGISALRDKISKKNGINNINSDCVLITPGGRFSVFATMAGLLKSGDEIITFEPAWPAYKESADFLDIKTRIVKTTFENNWSPEIKNLEKIINPNTKMIILNYPNNPTGKILDIGVMDKIVQIARDNNLYVLSDEVYADYVFSDFKGILDYGYENSIMVSSFSKSYAMTGFRVGYSIASKEIISRIKKIQAMAITSVAEPMQYCALRALEFNNDEYVDLIKNRINLISEKLSNMNLKFVYPDGAMYVFPKLHENIKDITLVYDLLNKGVALSPGSGFGKSYDEYIRISACQDISKLEKGLNILEEYLSNSY